MEKKIKKISLYLILSLILYSFVFGNEVWEKEIPPSHYLENFALKNQKGLNKGLKYWSYGTFLGGIVIAQANSNSPEEQTTAMILTILGLAGIVYDLVSKPETVAFKEYKKIKDIQDKNQKEKLSYEALVFLAKQSTEVRNKNNKNRDSSGKFFKDMAARILINELNEILLTPEQKVLNNYLEQKPIKYN